MRRIRSHLINLSKEEKEKNGEEVFKEIKANSLLLLIKKKYLHL